MISRIEPYNHLPTKLISDAMTNRSNAVIRCLQKGNPQLIINFLDWVSTQLTQSNPLFLSELYFFVKYNSCDEQILQRIDKIKQSILYQTDEINMTFIPNVFENQFSDTGLKYKLAKRYLKALSQREKVALFSPNAEGNTVFHYLPCDVERIALFEKHCPSVLRKHLFTLNKEGRAPFCICRSSPRCDEKIVDFLFSRANRENAISLSKELAPSEVLAKCSLGTWELYMSHLPSGDHEKKLFAEDINLLMLCVANKKEIYQRAKILLDYTPHPLRRKFFESEVPGEMLAVELVDACPMEIQPKIRELFFIHCPKELLEKQLESLDNRIAILELLEVVEKEKQKEELSAYEEVWKNG